MQHDIAIVGAGIVGLSHAWIAAREGKRVILFEKSPRSLGASIRNFGMIWPIGQPAGEMHEVALASRSLWCEIAKQAGFWLRECGSIHLAHREDEWHVLEEFAARAASLGYDCALLTDQQVLQKTPAVNPENLRGGLWSPTEMCIDPREVMRVLPGFLQDQYGVEVHFSSPVTSVSGSELKIADGRSWRAEEILIASGSDFEMLFPEVFASSGLYRCKLQMMRTPPQPAGREIGPHLASGLTLRHYANFLSCRSLEQVKQRIRRETPELDRFGIHVMAAQNGRGEVILGDSHEYDSVADPFCCGEIDELILRELHKVIRLDDWSIAERWYGQYSKHPSLPYFATSPQSGVTIVTGLGGAGMTLSFGVAAVGKQTLTVCQPATAAESPFESPD